MTKWPPVHYESGGLSSIFQRLDSAFDRTSAPSKTGGDNDSLLDSESEAKSISGK